MVLRLLRVNLRLRGLSLSSVLFFLPLDTYPPCTLACGIIMLFYFSCSYYVGFNFVGQSSYLSIPVFILSRPACWLVCPFGTLFSPLILTIASTSVHICVYLYPPCTSVLDFRSRLFVFSYLFTFLYSLLHMTYLGRSFFRTPSLF